MSSPKTRTALIAGAEGQVGLALQTTAPQAWHVVACGRSALDITEEEAVRKLIHDERPDLVINAAGYTAVDAAEGDPARADAVNVRGAANVAHAAREAGARLLYVSTDFVFDGRQKRPYAPGDVAHALSVYGRSKLDGEREVARISDGSALTVRTAWVYSAYRRNFVLTMLRLMREQDAVSVVDDQVGTPTWANGLAEALWAAADHPEMRGVHHWTDDGVATWYDFAVAIQETAVEVGLLDRSVPVRPIRTADFQAPAARPAYSVLDKTATWAALGRSAPHWRVNLRLMLEELRHG